MQKASIQIYNMKFNKYYEFVILTILITLSVLWYGWCYTLIFTCILYLTHLALYIYFGKQKTVLKFSI